MSEADVIRQLIEAFGNQSESPQLDSWTEKALAALARLEAERDEAQKEQRASDDYATEAFVAREEARQALREIERTPSRDWHLNGRLARAALRDDTAAVAPAETTSEPGWAVIESYTTKVVAEYPTRQEAEDAAEWHQRTFGGPSLEVCRAAVPSGDAEEEG